MRKKRVAVCVTAAALAFPAIALPFADGDQVKVQTTGEVLGTLSDGRVVVSTKGGVVVLPASEVSPIATPTPTASPTPTSSPTATPTPSPSPSPALTLDPVDGGQNYYSKFSNPLPSSQDFFPIGVWFESVTQQADIDKDKAAGLNTYIALTTNSSPSIIRNNGMWLFPHADEWNTSTQRAKLGSEAAGWSVHDEIDMQVSPSTGPDQLAQEMGRLPADGRLRYNNFGKGVAYWETDNEAARYVNLPGLNVVSDDIYWFTDPRACGESSGKPGVVTANGCRHGANYGWLVNRVRTLDARDGNRKPVWAFVELGWPFTETASQNARAIQPAEVRSAVWHSLIAGARGVIYFNHSFGGSCQSQHILRESCYSAIRSTVTQVNSQIKQIAPALNGPTVTSGWSHDATTKATMKWDGANLYVIAGSAGGAASSKFTASCVGDATATVLGENRSIDISNGSFSDGFSDANAIHIYRIDGGSSCGL
jgi:hypothetical protein